MMATRFVSLVRGLLLALNDEPMKKVKPKPKTKSNGMRAEYEFRRGVRGKYASRYKLGTNLVQLDPDIAELFPDSASVNAALRVLARLGLKDKKRRSRTVSRRKQPA
jgi:hypothetical protein